jgi:mRNA interferase MazF
VQRGEVFALPSPRGARGREQQGKRYGVVLQADELLALSTVLVAPTSTRARPASFRPEVEIDGTKTRVMLEQLGAVDPQRLGDSVGVIARDELRAVERAAVVVLGLTE